MNSQDVRENTNTSDPLSAASTPSAPAQHRHPLRLIQSAKPVIAPAKGHIIVIGSSPFANLTNLLPNTGAAPMVSPAPAKAPFSAAMAPSVAPMAQKPLFSPLQKQSTNAFMRTSSDRTSSMLLDEEKEDEEEFVTESDEELGDDFGENTSQSSSYSSSTQSSGTSGSSSGSSAAASRKHKSLSALSKRFVEHFQKVADDADKENTKPGESQVSSSSPSRLEIKLDSAAVQLGVEKRRIYDIVNVLESVNVLEKRHVSLYVWNGLEHMPATLRRLKEDGTASQQLYEGINSLDTNDKTNTSLRNALQFFSATVKSRPSSSSSADSFVSGSSGSSSGSEQKKKEKSLTSLTQRFVQLFLLSKSVFVSNEQAQQVLISSSNMSDPSARTKARRLQDICNILSSVGLIDKVSSLSEFRRAGYQWIGECLTEIPDVAAASPSLQPSVTFSPAMEAAPTASSAVPLKKRKRVPSLKSSPPRMAATAGAGSPAPVEDAMSLTVNGTMRFCGAFPLNFQFNSPPAKRRRTQSSPPKEKLQQQAASVASTSCSPAPAAATVAASGTAIQWHQLQPLGQSSAQQLSAQGFSIHPRANQLEPLRRSPPRLQPSLDCTDVPSKSQHLIPLKDGSKGVSAAPLARSPSVASDLAGTMVTGHTMSIVSPLRPKSGRVLASTATTHFPTEMAAQTFGEDGVPQQQQQQQPLFQASQSTTARRLRSVLGASTDTANLNESRSPIQEITPSTFHDESKRILFTVKRRQPTAAQQQPISASRLGQESTSNSFTQIIT